MHNIRVAIKTSLTLAQCVQWNGNISWLVSEVYTSIYTGEQKHSHQSIKVEWGIPKLNFYIAVDSLVLILKRTINERFIASSGSKRIPPPNFPIKPPFDNKIGPDIYNVFIWDMYNMEYVMIVALCIFAVLINVSMNCLLMEISTNFATILVKNMINRNYLSGYYLGLASTEKLPCGTVINNSNQSLQ